MKIKKNLTILLATLLVAAMPVVLITGQQRVPISFDRYHGYHGTVDYLERVAAAHPEITELIEIGKSALGRPIHVLVISNMSNGTTIDRHVTLENQRQENVQNVAPQKSYHGKPGHFISGATHGNEYTGTEVCLYIIDKLVSGYGVEPEITEILDRAVFYILPIDNPDGVFNSVEMGTPQRANSMYRDGDLEGTPVPNGLSTQFRIESEEGQWVEDDKDPRYMVRLRRDQQTDKQRYNVVTAYFDDEGNLRRGQSRGDGIDMNRNYPEGWWTEDNRPAGTGQFPTSAPSVYHRVDFLFNNPNILNAQSFHTMGGFTYRPMGSASHTAMHQTDVVMYDFVFGRKYIEILGGEVPEAWLNPQNIEQFRQQMRREGANRYSQMRGYNLPPLWRVSYNENADRRYGFGMDSDYFYEQLGMYAVTTELWNPRRDIPGLDIPDDRAPNDVLQRALLRYQDEHYDGDLFVNWTRATHPDLGEGERGGWRTIYARNNAWPGAPLLHVAEMHWQFELWRAQMLPDLAISEATVNVLHTTRARDASVDADGDRFNISSERGRETYRLVEITAVLENRGGLPTHLARGAALPMNRQDVVWLIGDRRNLEFIEGRPWERIGVLGGTKEVPGLLLGDDNKRTVRWLVGVTGDQPLKIVLTSQKGGTVVKELSLR